MLNEHELEKTSTVKESLTVQKEGNHQLPTALKDLGKKLFAFSKMGKLVYQIRYAIMFFIKA
jgi:hypothetical protein